MKKVFIALASFAVALALIVAAVGRWLSLREAGPAMEPERLTDPAFVHDAAERPRGFLYGRVTTVDGAAYEGRLRFGGAGEAFWDDLFGGFKADNPWARFVPPEQLVVREPVVLFGVTVRQRERPVELRRPFQARFGDITRIEPGLDDIRVTLKSGRVVILDRQASDDLGLGLRIWDRERGEVELGEVRIRAIELRPTGLLEAAPKRLFGTVRTRAGTFSGAIRWDHRRAVATDLLRGEVWADTGVAGSAEAEPGTRAASAAADGADTREIGLPLGDIASIARLGLAGGEGDPAGGTPGGPADGPGDESADADEGVRVTLRDGTEIALAGTREVGPGHHGTVVDDPRYGRVLVSWAVLERIDLAHGEDHPGSGPAHEDFPPGEPLRGRVTTRDGRRLAGRLVFDLDESETTDTLDAPADGVDYIIPFGLVASIEPAGSGDEGDPRSLVRLHGGETLRLERAGDLGEGNGGLLVFTDDGGDDDPRPVYVRWAEVAAIDLERPGLSPAAPRS